MVGRCDSATAYVKETPSLGLFFNWLTLVLCVEWSEHAGPRASHCIVHLLREQRIVSVDAPSDEVASDKRECSYLLRNQQGCSELFDRDSPLCRRACALTVSLYQAI